MPTYCYRREDNEEIVEKIFGMHDEHPETIEIVEYDGNEEPVVVTARRDYLAERGERRRDAGSGWPLTCYASGVHPHQAGELRDYLSKHGVPTEVTKDGDCHHWGGLAVRPLDTLARQTPRRHRHRRKEIPILFPRGRMHCRESAADGDLVVGAAPV